MAATITPLRRRGKNQSVFARIDLHAVDLLAKGRTASLQEARAETIITDLRLQREEMTAILSNLRERDLTGVTQIDATNANLITAINEGVVQIDLFIAEARGFLDRTAQSEASSPNILGETGKGV